MGQGAFSSFDVSASGMTAERLRMNVIANNLANVNTTRTQDGGPYQRRYVVFEEVLADARSRLDGLMGDVGAGVRVVEYGRDAKPGARRYEPGHPDADADGMLEMPNVEPWREMLDMMNASRGYEANVAAISAAKQMILKALEI
jgi:flagellar basal-body rod protein FlgC